MNILLSVLPTITFIVGFYFGFSIKDAKPPEINPVKIVKQKQEEVKQEKKKEALDQYLENIDNYPNNQKVIKE